MDQLQCLHIVKSKEGTHTQYMKNIRVTISAYFAHGVCYQINTFVVVIVVVSIIINKINRNKSKRKEQADQNEMDPFFFF